MADTFTIAAAARLCHCDRRTLQRAIHTGRLHLDTQHCLSREDLIAAGYLVIDTPQGMPLSTPQSPPHGPPRESPLFAPLLALLERLTTAVEGVWQEMQRLRETSQQPPHGAPQRAPQEVPLSTPQETPQEAPQEAPQSAPQDTPHGTPQDTAYNPTAAFARIQALRTEGRTLAQIAAQLNAEGVSTRRGRPWLKGMVGWFLNNYGKE